MSAPASTRRRVLAQTSFEARAILRNGEQLLVTIIVPVLVLVGLTRVTMLLGLVFMGGVVIEWREALESFPPGTVYGSNFVMLIGLHAFHVITGLIALAFVTRLGGLGRFSSADHWGAEGVIKYWHFVDLVWVVIYPTLYLF